MRYGVVIILIIGGCGVEDTAGDDLKGTTEPSVTTSNGGQVRIRMRKSAPIARDDASPGDSIPNRCQKPSMP